MTEQHVRSDRTAAAALSAVHRHARELTGSIQDYEPLLDLLAQARFALLGEASHGTHDFYHARAEITKRLILEQGFAAIAVEADWPDAYRVNRYVRGTSDDPDANAALSGFKRFPAWMWRNTVVLEFVQWLREHNDSQPPERKVGFYGIDLYSLLTSIEAVLAYLEKVDPAAASARAIATRASNISAKTRRRTVMRPPSASARPVRMRSYRSSSS